MPFPVAMMLAAFAQVQDGGLTVVGAGWTVRDPEPAGTAAIGVMIAVPRELAGKAIETRLELHDAAGERVQVTPLSEDREEVGDPGEIQVEGEIVAEGLDDPAITIPLMVPLAVTLPPFRLPAGREFRWQLFLDGETRPEWALPFRTTPPEPG